jgi:hypothetical protein
VEAPGSLTDNPGFEQGLYGWVAAGSVASFGHFEGVTPSEGSRQAVLRSNGRLQGYLDVPPDATRLSFSATVFSAMGEFDPGLSVVELYSPQPAIVFDAAVVKQKKEACNCEDFGARVGPIEVGVDLTPFRGKPLVISADVSSNYIGIGMNHYALVLDDFRLERSEQKP